MPPHKAYFENLDRPNSPKIEVQLNPTELTFAKAAQFAEIAIPGLDGPVLQFVRGAAETLALELLFDTTDSGMGENAASVTAKINDFYSLVKQDPERHAPPRCRFSWGPPPAEGPQPDAAVSNAPFWFTCVVESVERRFLLFSPEGTPLRARLNVRLREYKTVEQMVAGHHSADHTRARVLKRRQRLDQLSTDAYATPTEWRRIADENGIDDPRRVPPGTLLRVPPMRVESATRRATR